VLLGVRAGVDHMGGVDRPCSFDQQSKKVPTRGAVSLRLRRPRSSCIKSSPLTCSAAACKMILQGVGYQQGSRTRRRTGSRENSTAHCKSDAANTTTTTYKAPIQHQKMGLGSNGGGVMNARLPALAGIVDVGRVSPRGVAATARVEFLGNWDGVFVDCYRRKQKPEMQFGLGCTGRCQLQGAANERSAAL
jgi:hypothetical protein